MDEIFNLYNELIQLNNPYFEYAGSNKHLQNINYFRNCLKDEIDTFKAHVIQLKIASGKLSSMVHLVFIKEVKGHVEMKEPGYASLWAKYQQHIDDAERHYKYIRSYQEYIREEYQAIETQKTMELADSFSLNQVLNTPELPVNATQLSLF